jgi:hypothetical protein
MLVSPPQAEDALDVLYRFQDMHGQDVISLLGYLKSTTSYWLNVEKHEH